MTIKRVINRILKKTKMKNTNCLIITLSENNAQHPTTHPFFDYNGYCTYDLGQKAEANYKYLYFKTFGHNTKYKKQVSIVFIENNPNTKKQFIRGWYASATVFLDTQYDIGTNTYYMIKCKTSNAHLLHNNNKIEIDDALYSFNKLQFIKLESTSLSALLCNKINKPDFIDISLDISQSNKNITLTVSEIKDLYNQFNKTKESIYLKEIYYASYNLLKNHTNKNLEEILYYIGYSLINIAKTSKALSYFKQLYEINPNYKDVIDLIGTCLSLMNKDDAVIEWYNQIHNDTRSKESVINLAVAYENKGYQKKTYQLLKTIEDKEISILLEELEQDLPFLSTNKTEYNLYNSYPIFTPFHKEKLPSTYVDTNGVLRFIDPIRKKGVPATPEENVRQQVISYLLNKTLVPEECILVEESLTHIDRSVRGRVDILVTANAIKRTYNLLLIECKAPEIILEGNPTAQILQYNSILNASYILLTNGLESYLYQLDKNNQEYRAMAKLPTYDEMCHSQNIAIMDLPSYEWKRPSYEQLCDNDTIDKYIYEGLLGEDTPKQMAPFIINLASCILDENHRIPCPLQLNTITIEQDNGIISMETGNAGGGSFYGNYRWLTVTNRHNQTQNVYFAIFATAPSKDDAHWKNRKGVSCFYFAVEENGKAVSRLQISLDTCLKKEKLGYRVTHSGVRSRKKIEPLIQFISNINPDLLGKSERINLGYLDNTKNLYLSNINVIHVIGNALEYTLLRSELRQIEG